MNSECEYFSVDKLPLFFFSKILLKLPTRDPLNTSVITLVKTITHSKGTYIIVVGNFIRPPPHRRHGSTVFVAKKIH